VRLRHYRNSPAVLRRSTMGAPVLQCSRETTAGLRAGVHAPGRFPRFGPTQSTISAVWLFLGIFVLALIPLVDPN
jgi:hypothetical protein